MTPEAIVMCILGGVVSLMFGILLHTIKKWQGKNDERYRERCQSEALKDDLLDATGSVTYETATEAQKKGIGNGELQRKLDRFVASKDALAKHQRALAAKHDVK